MEKSRLPSYKPSHVAWADRVVATVPVTDSELLATDSLVTQPPKLVTPTQRKRKVSTRKAKSKKKRTVSSDKPHRPLTAYNLFFRDERAKVVRSEANDSPCKIGFAEMARIISPRWKTLDKKIRMEYERKAVEERKIYFTALAEWEQAKRREREEKNAKVFNQVRQLVLTPVVCSPRPVRQVSFDGPEDISLPISSDIFEEGDYLNGDKELDKIHPVVSPTDCSLPPLEIDSLIHSDTDYFPLLPDLEGDARHMDDPELDKLLSTVDFSLI